jgi:hypothetical protein
MPEVRNFKVPGPFTREVSGDFCRSRIIRVHPCNPWFQLPFKAESMLSASRIGTQNAHSQTAEAHVHFPFSAATNPSRPARTAPPSLPRAVNV